jgi:nucleotide-binding universal stress UspA family protein
MGRTVVVPLTGSPRDDSAVAAAEHLAHRAAADLRAVDVRRERVAVALTAAVGDDDALVCVAAGNRPLARRVLSSFEIPIVVVGPRCREDWEAGRRLFACVDGSARSEAVVPVACRWARALGLAPWLLDVVGPQRLPSDDVLDANYVGALAAGLRRGGVRVGWEVLHGRRPATAIATHAAANGGALVAMGTGHLTRRVVKESPTPVLVTPSAALWDAVMALAAPPSVPVPGSAA